MAVATLTVAVAYAVRATSAVHAPVAASPCAGSVLTTLGGRNGNAIAVTGNGIVVGVADAADGQSRAVMWRAGGITLLDVGLESAVPTSVNRHGIVVGTGYDPKAEMPVGWWWDGKGHRLPVPAGHVAVPEAIDDAGHVAGAMLDDEEHADGPNADDSERAAYWPSVHAMVRELPALAGDDAAHAFAIAPDGTVGGVSLGSGGTPVVWNRSGQVHRLAVLSGYGGLVHGFDAGSRPVGQAALPDGDSHAVVWDSAGKPADLGAPGRTSVATDAASGAVVGYGGAPGQRTQAIAWLAGTGHVLEPVSTAVFDGVAGTANAVADASDSITVAGFSADAAGVRQPTVWSCRR